MTIPRSCVHESDVLDLVAIGQWPGRAEPALRAHVDACDICADLAMVASAVVTLRDTSAPPSRVPDASIVWHTAQRRARLEASQRAAWPMVAAQSLTACSAIGFAVLAWWTGLVQWTGFASMWRGLTSMFSTTSPLSLIVLGGLALLVILVPVAVSVVAFADRGLESQTDQH